jgi:molecular chaperone GrpE
MEVLRREKEEAQERLLRKHADLENARKRLEREKQEFIRFAGSELIRRLLPVLDNLERALDAPGDVDDSLREGIRLVHQQFLEVLKKEGLEPVEALGRPFDPTLHEAVLREETADGNPDEVIGVLQKGYSFRGRLLRPAMVKVAVRPAGPAEEAGETGDAADAGETEEAEGSEEADRPEETI